MSDYCCFVAFLLILLFEESLQVSSVFKIRKKMSCHCLAAFIVGLASILCSNSKLNLSGEKDRTTKHNIGVILCDKDERFFSIGNIKLGVFFI